MLQVCLYAYMPKIRYWSVSQPLVMLRGGRRMRRRHVRAYGKGVVVLCCVALLCSAVLSLSLSPLCGISRCERFACICWAVHKGGGQYPSSIRATAPPHRMCMVRFAPVLARSASKADIFDWNFWMACGRTKLWRRDDAISQFGRQRVRE
jgi:hypothetical protein